ncbi:MAG TPA: TRAP transporter substrate-binding protein [Pseudolabrys sp.]|nr:TRAP transporter substrate-binding protein [Pseudolabrys sp.]
MSARPLCTAAALAFALVASALDASAAPVTLRFSSFEPPQAFITKEILTPWAERVTADSKGTLKIEMFAGGTLGRDPASQMKLVMNGVADIAWIVPGYTPGRFDQTTSVELPFVVPNAYVGSVASWRMYEKGLWKGGGFDEIKPLCVCTSAPSVINTTYPAHDLADLKDHKFRGGGPVLLNVIKSLGGVPIGGITGPQLAESLSRGLIDGTLNEWNSLQTFRALDVTKSHIVAPLGSLSLMVIMNKQKYASLPPEAKAAIDKNSGEAFSKLFGTMFDKNNDAVFAKVKASKDHTVLILDKEQQKPWRAAIEPVYTDWKKSTPNGDKLLQALRDEVAAVEAGK